MTRPSNRPTELNDGRCSPALSFFPSLCNPSEHRNIIASASNGDGSGGGGRASERASEMREQATLKTTRDLNFCFQDALECLELSNIVMQIHFT